MRVMKTEKMKVLKQKGSMRMPTEKFETEDFI